MGVDQGLAGFAVDLTSRSNACCALCLVTGPVWTMSLVVYYRKFAKTTTDTDVRNMLLRQ